MNFWKEIDHSWANVEKTYSKSEIAKSQLCTAIWLFLNRIDFASAITLSGASGEILHKILEFNGKQSFFEYGREEFQKIIGNNTLKKSKYITNFRKITGISSLKHKSKNCPDELIIDLEYAAEKAVTAAVLDYIKLYGQEEPAIKNFLSYLWVKYGEKIIEDYEEVLKHKKNALPNLKKVESPKKYNILDLAEEQLRTAVILFLKGRDLISSITLAGAADVLLCQFVKDQGKENFTDHILKHENNPEKTIQIIGKEINDMFCINALKHMDNIDDNGVTMNLRENAVGAILKALPNYIELRGSDQDFVKFFLLWIRANLDPEKYNIYCDPNWAAKP